MHTSDSDSRAKLGDLRQQLDTLIGLTDELRNHLEAERDLAARRGDTRAVSALEQGVLQVTRVRNDVWAAYRDLDDSRAAVQPPIDRAAA